MAVKIRLLRMGRKKKPFYRIVAIDTKSRRDGRYLDKVGYYDPLTKPATVKIEKEKVLEWLEKGAIPSETVFNLLQKEGIALEWHLTRNKMSDQAKNVEIQKWELSRKKTSEPVEEIEKPKVTKPKKAKTVVPSENDAMPEAENEIIPEVEEKILPETVAENTPEIESSENPSNVSDEETVEAQPET